MSGTRVESPILSPQMYLSGYGLLAALAVRLSATHARAVLDMLADAVESRNITTGPQTEATLRFRQVLHAPTTGSFTLLHLTNSLGCMPEERIRSEMLRATRSWPTSTRSTIGWNQWPTRGHREAAALIAYSDPDQVSPEAAEAAARRLRTPTTNAPGSFGVGTGAVNDSLLAAVLPVDERIACIEMLMSNARSPWEGSSNRDSYLVAASNLIDDLDEQHRRQFFDAAIDFAANPPLSEVDAFHASMRNPLGSMRINDSSDSRPAAAFLAARLANSPGGEAHGPRCRPSSYRRRHR